MSDKGNVVIREAHIGDLAALIAIFAADDKGGHGDTTAPDAFSGYREAFEAITASANETLYVAETNGIVVGTFQTTYSRALPGRGGANLILEAVQTHPDYRGKGVGATMVRAAIEEAKKRDCRLVQLMSNAGREDAHRFYERMGFRQSHLGFKMKLK